MTVGDLARNLGRISRWGPGRLGRRTTTCAVSMKMKRLGVGGRKEERRRREMMNREVALWSECGWTNREGDLGKFGGM